MGLGEIIILIACSEEICGKCEEKYNEVSAKINKF